MTLQRLSHFGGVPKSFIERGDNPEKGGGLDIEMGGGGGGCNGGGVKFPLLLFGSSVL